MRRELNEREERMNHDNTPTHRSFHAGMATLYEVTGIQFPSVVDAVEQQPLDGASDRLHGSPRRVGLARCT
jgi:hypothetical protein